MTHRLVTKDAIAETYDLIRPHIRRTPVLDWAEDGFAPGAVTLKLELLQYAGSFKTRGAFANLLTREIPAAGVCAASGGNHGAAVAYAAMKRGVPAHVFVPAISAPAKIARIRDFGAELVVGGDSYADALAASEEWRRGKDALAIHAFDQVETMLGQGTLALEFEEQAPGLDTILVAVGGGGLIAGIAAWCAGRIRVIGVEPEASQPLPMPSPQASPWTHPWAAWPRIRWRRAGSARMFFPSSKPMSSAWRWFRTGISPRPRKPCGGGDGWPPNPAAPRLSRLFYAGAIFRAWASASGW